MKKALKILASLISFFLTALSVSQAMKKRDEMNADLKKQ